MLELRVPLLLLLLCASLCYAQAPQAGDSCSTSVDCQFMFGDCSLICAANFTCIANSATCQTVNNCGSFPCPGSCTCNILTKCCECGESSCANSASSSVSASVPASETPSSSSRFAPSTSPAPAAPSASPSVSLVPFSTIQATPDAPASVSESPSPSVITNSNTTTNDEEHQEDEEIDEWTAAWIAAVVVGIFLVLVCFILLGWLAYESTTTYTVVSDDSDTVLLHSHAAAPAYESTFTYPPGGGSSHSSIRARFQPITGGVGVKYN